jgi:hypothetical protein
MLPTIVAALGGGGDHERREMGAAAVRFAHAANVIHYPDSDGGATVGIA